MTATTTTEWMDDNSAQVTAAESNDPDVETLKREYYMLKHNNDFKKRIDIVFWESTRDQLKIFAGEMKAREAVHHAITDGLGVYNPAWDWVMSREIDSK